MINLRQIGITLTSFSLLGAVLFCMSLLGDSELFQALDGAYEAVNNDYDRAYEVINESNHEVHAINNEMNLIEDDAIPMAMFQEYTGVGVGEIIDCKFMMYSILGARLDKEHQQMILTIEVFNKSKDVVDFTPFNRMKIYSKSTVEGIALSSDPLLATGRRLSGLIQPGNRICGEVNFNIPAMFDDKCYLAITSDEGRDEVVFEITTGDIGQSYDAHFDNGEIMTPYTLDVPMVSDIFTLTLKEVNYEESDREGMKLVLCKFILTNHTHDDQTFLEGFNILHAHNLEGYTLQIDGEGITIPRVLEGDVSVTGYIPIYIPEDQKGFYLTVRLDDSDFDSKALIVVNGK